MDSLAGIGLVEDQIAVFAGVIDGEELCQHDIEFGSAEPRSGQSRSDDVRVRKDLSQRNLPVEVGVQFVDFVDHTLVVGAC